VAEIGKISSSEYAMDTCVSRLRNLAGARFEELDAVVVFDDVFVPWERVFLYRDVPRCNQAYTATGTVVHMTHQVVTRTIAKTEFLLGLASLLIDTLGVEPFQHIHEKVTEIWVALEALKAFMRAAEADAQLDQFGIMRPAWDPLDAARHFYPKTYPRLIEILQQIGASGLVAVPTAADLNGPLADDITHYYQAGPCDGCRAHSVVPSRLGHGPVGVWHTPGVVRALLLWRSRAHGECRLPDQRSYCIAGAGTALHSHSSRT
jgi:hypothetical protein